MTFFTSSSSTRTTTTTTTATKKQRVFDGRHCASSPWQRQRAYTVGHYVLGAYTGRIYCTIHCTLRAYSGQLYWRINSSDIFDNRKCTHCDKCTQRQLVQIYIAYLNYATSHKSKHNRCAQCTHACIFKYMLAHRLNYTHRDAVKQQTFKTFIYCTKYLFKLYEIFIYYMRYLFTTRNIYLLHEIFIYYMRYLFTTWNVYLLH